jgi:hypothetical protein
VAHLQVKIIMALRTITFDDEDLDSVSRTINILNSFRGTLRARSGTATVTSRCNAQYNAAKAIIETRTAYLYGNYVQRRSRGCYVYMHCEADRKLHRGKSGVINFLLDCGVEYMPFYVGKGVGSRDICLDRNETHRKVRQRLQTFGKDVVVKRVAEDLSEKDALALESRWLDVLGLRVNGGMLVNLDEGVETARRRVLYKEHLVVLSEFYQHSVK